MCGFNWTAISALGTLSASLVAIIMPLVSISNNNKKEKRLIKYQIIETLDDLVGYKNECTPHTDECLKIIWNGCFQAKSLISRAKYLYKINEYDVICDYIQKVLSHSNGFGYQEDYKHLCDYYEGHFKKER